MISHRALKFLIAKVLKVHRVYQFHHEANITTLLTNKKLIVEMKGVEPLSYIFASKHSYSLGFKDYPCHHEFIYDLPYTFLFLSKCCSAY